MGVIRWLSRKVIAVISRQIEYHKAERLALKKARVLERSGSFGAGVHFNGHNVNISGIRYLMLGNDVFIADNCNLQAEGGLTIGDDTHISEGVTICTRTDKFTGKELISDDERNHRSVCIGRNAWVGMNVLILPGVTIGDGAVIGMGVVVSEDVQPMDILTVGTNEARKKRNLDHYFVTKNQRNKGNIDSSIFKRNWIDNSEELVFVLSTGRAGSKSIAGMFNSHPDMECRHESVRQLIQLSTLYAEGIISKDKMRAILVHVFTVKKLSGEVNLTAESDQRLWNLIDLIHEILPGAKFIHLVRNGRDTVRSTNARHWFHEDDVHVNRSMWAKYRLNGMNLGVESWKEMSAFQKNCWYWQYINVNVSEAISQLPDHLTFTVQLESLENEKVDLFKFLGVSEGGIRLKKENAVKSVNKNDYDESWSPEENNQFREICGSAMNKFGYS